MVDIDEFDDFPYEDSDRVAEDNPVTRNIVEKELSEVEQFKIQTDDLLEGEMDPHSALMDMSMRYIQASGDVDDINECSYTNGNMVAIDGWAFNGDEDLTYIDLFLVVYKNPSDGIRISGKEIEIPFNKMKRFFEQSKNGKILDKIDDKESDLYQIAEMIHFTSKIDRLRLYFITNAIAPQSFTMDNEELEGGTDCEFYIWDVKRMMQQDNIMTGKSPIIVDFDGEYNSPLPFLKMPDVSDKVECYLCIIPGTVLAQIYNKYNQQILEMNVRTFLQFKGSSNKGIRDTLIGHKATPATIRKGDRDKEAEPEMFFAYNNGISTTASSVDIIETDEGFFISRIKDWQIVNGGQTTAAISTVMKMKNVDKSKLSKVYVPMKVSLIKKKEDILQVVPLISKYANTQSVVKKSDFNANEPFLVDMEQLSRQEWAKDLSGKPISKWFFERARGQYMVMLKRNVTKTQEREFEAEYPKGQMFDKALFAKFMMAWLQDPASVCKGGENNYSKFYGIMQRQNFRFDANQYHRAIAKLILFKTIDAYYGKEGIKLQGYKSNMVAYTLSVLSQLSNKALNLKAIWNEQYVISSSALAEITIDMPTIYARLLTSDEHVSYKVKTVIKDDNGRSKSKYVVKDLSKDDILNIKKTTLYKIMRFVKKIEPAIWEHITNVDNGVNINEWTKMPRCWEVIKTKILSGDFDYTIPDELLSSYTDDEVEVNDGQKRLIEEAYSHTSEEWSNLKEWGDKNNRLSPRESVFLQQMSRRLARNLSVSYKQAKWMLDIMEKLKRMGWSYI